MKKKKKVKNNKVLVYKIIIFSLLAIIIGLSGFIAGYLINQKETTKEIKHYQNTLLTLQSKIDKLSKEIKIHNKKPQKEYSIQNSEIIDYLHATKNQPIAQNQKEIKPLIKIKKPKLVIIVDDVAFKNEVKLIKSIPFKITPSFFPPTKNHPNTPIYAKSFSHYMIHLPMEAMHFAKPEPNTLLITDNYTTIKTRIDKIKKEFPKATFINNHTGSKFTSNLESMNYLFLALKNDHLGFVDSKTTPYSKSAQVEKIHKIPFFKRDIFLDNKQDPNYIKNQLKKAIKIAKKRGYAIAIAHPHKITLQTLKNSKKILSQVDVVYIDELAKYAKN